MIERLAIWYLSRRGRTVLPFPFIGLVIGYGVATKTGDAGGYVEWQVSMPKTGKIIALNNSVVTNDAPVR